MLGSINVAEVETKLSGLEDRFCILSELGSGATGAVFKARDLILNRIVAIKVLHAGYEPGAVTRFQREAKATSRFDHPNLVRVLDFGVDVGGKPYLVMEHLDGEDLRTLIERVGALLEIETLSIALQLSRALAHAHDKGILHRDLKPSNVIVQKLDGEEGVKLLDFGLAKLLDANQSLTTSGATVGTVLYISPEVVDGKPSDERSDLYALGCLLFECLTGRPPFCGETAHQTMMMHSQIAPGEINRKGQPLSSFMDNLVHKLLEKNPNNRFQSAQELRTEIESHLASKIEAEMNAAETTSEIPTQSDFNFNHLRKSSRELPDKYSVNKVENKHAKILAIILIVVLIAAAAIAFGDIYAKRHQRDDISAKVDTSTLDSKEPGLPTNSTEYAFRDDKSPSSESPDKISGFTTDEWGHLSTVQRTLHAPSTETDAKLIKEIESENFAKIVIKNRPVTKALMSAIVADKDLWCLHINGCTNFTPELAERLPEIGGLKELNLTSTHVNDAHMSFIAKAARLETLCIDGNPGITGAGLRKLYRHPELCRVQMGGTSVTSKNLKEFLKNRPPKLRNVRAAALKLTDNNIASLDFHGIRTLSLASNPITKRSVEFVAKFPSIAHLHLTGCKMLDDDCILPLANLQLETLSLSETKVASLAGLGKLQNLSFLYLDNCPGISDTSLRQIEGLHLEKLSLNGSGITDRGLKILARMKPKKTKEVIEISLRNCPNLTQSGRDYLKNFKYLKTEKLELE